MRLSFLAAAVLILPAGLMANANTIPLTSASQLSSSDVQVLFPTVPVSTPVSGLQLYSANGNVLTFSNTTNQFEEDTVGTTYFNTGFPNGTNILYSAGFSGSTAPVTVSFATPVSEFGFNAEEFAVGNETFNLNVYDGASLVGNYTFTGNDPNTLAFLGAAGQNGTVITSFTLSDTTGNDIAIGPLSIGTSIAPTPEPTSLALLGTGLFGLMGAARKRFA